MMDGLQAAGPVLGIARSATGRRWTWREGDALVAAGFVLDQTDLVDTRQGLTVSRLGAFRTFQSPIADIAAEAGLDVGALAAADTFVRRGLRPVVARELQGVDDIVL